MRDRSNPHHFQPINEQSETTMQLPFTYSPRHFQTTDEQSDTDEQLYFTQEPRDLCEECY